MAPQVEPYRLMVDMNTDEGLQAHEAPGTANLRLRSCSEMSSILIARKHTWLKLEQGPGPFPQT